MNKKIYFIVIKGSWSDITKYKRIYKGHIDGSSMLIFRDDHGDQRAWCKDLWKDRIVAVGSELARLLYE